MSAPSSNSVSPADAAVGRRRSAVVVAACTMLCGISQILIKTGMGPAHFVPTVIGLITNVPLVAGYALYGVFTVAMVLALKEGELSMLYPIIALSYVWVTLLSYWLLRETPNRYRNLGVITIVVGVAILGRGGKK